MVVKKNTVYVIDDDESIRKSFSRLLRSANFNVETYPAPEDFLCSQIESENACILMDVCMPGSTGFDLQQRLTASGIFMPVIVISASDDFQIREIARKLGAILFFRKPIDDQALLDAILWAISGARNRNK